METWGGGVCSVRGQEGGRGDRVVSKVLPPRAREEAGVGGAGGAGLWGAWGVQGVRGCERRLQGWTPGAWSRQASLVPRPGISPGSVAAQPEVLLLQPQVPWSPGWMPCPLAPGRPPLRVGNEKHRPGFSWQRQRQGLGREPSHQSLMIGRPPAPRAGPSACPQGRAVPPACGLQHWRRAVPGVGCVCVGGVGGTRALWPPAGRSEPSRSPAPRGLSWPAPPPRVAATSRRHPGRIGDRRQPSAFYDRLGGQPVLQGRESHCAFFLTFMCL